MAAYETYPKGFMNCQRDVSAAGACIIYYAMARRGILCLIDVGGPDSCRER